MAPNDSQCVFDARSLPKDLACAINDYVVALSSRGLVELRDQTLRSTFEFDQDPGNITVPRLMQKLDMAHTLIVDMLRAGRVRRGKYFAIGVEFDAIEGVYYESVDAETRTTRYRHTEESDAKLYRDLFGGVRYNEATDPTLKDLPRVTVVRNDSVAAQLHVLKNRGVYSSDIEMNNLDQVFETIMIMNEAILETRSFEFANQEQYRKYQQIFDYFLQQLCQAGIKTALVAGDRGLYSQQDLNDVLFYLKQARDNAYHERIHCTRERVVQYASKLFYSQTVRRLSSGATCRRAEAGKAAIELGRAWARALEVSCGTAEIQAESNARFEGPIIAWRPSVEEHWLDLEEDMRDFVRRYVTLPQDIDPDAYLPFDCVQRARFAAPRWHAPVNARHVVRAIRGIKSLAPDGQSINYRTPLAIKAKQAGLRRLNRDMVNDRLFISHSTINASRKLLAGRRTYERSTSGKAAVRSTSSKAAVRSKKSSGAISKSRRTTGASSVVDDDSFDDDEDEPYRIPDLTVSRMNRLLELGDMTRMDMWQDEGPTIDEEIKEADAKNEPAEQDPFGQLGDQYLEPGKAIRSTAFRNFDAGPSQTHHVYIRSVLHAYFVTLANIVEMMSIARDQYPSIAKYIVERISVHERDRSVGISVQEFVVQLEKTASEIERSRLDDNIAKALATDLTAAISLLLELQERFNTAIHSHVLQKAQAHFVGSGGQPLGVSYKLNDLARNILSIMTEIYSRSPEAFGLLVDPAVEIERSVQQGDLYIDDNDAEVGAMRADVKALRSLNLVTIYEKMLEISMDSILLRIDASVDHSVKPDRDGSPFNEKHEAAVALFNVDHIITNIFSDMDRYVRVQAAKIRDFRRYRRRILEDETSKQLVEYYGQFLLMKLEDIVDDVVRPENTLIGEVRVIWALSIRNVLPFHPQDFDERDVDVYVNKQLRPILDVYRATMFRSVGSLLTACAKCIVWLDTPNSAAILPATIAALANLKKNSDIYNKLAVTILNYVPIFNMGLSFETLLTKWPMPEPESGSLLLRVAVPLHVFIIEFEGLFRGGNAPSSYSFAARNVLSHLFGIIAIIGDMRQKNNPIHHAIFHQGKNEALPRNRVDVIQTARKLGDPRTRTSELFNIGDDYPHTYISEIINGYIANRLLEYEVSSRAMLDVEQAPGPLEYALYMPPLAPVFAAICDRGIEGFNDLVDCPPQESGEPVLSQGALIAFYDPTFVRETLQRSDIKEKNIEPKDIEDKPLMLAQLLRKHDFIDTMGLLARVDISMFYRRLGAGPVTRADQGGRLTTNLSYMRHNLDILEAQAEVLMSLAASRPRQFLEFPSVSDQYDTPDFDSSIDVQGPHFAINESGIESWDEGGSPYVPPPRPEGADDFAEIPLTTNSPIQDQIDQQERSVEVELPSAESLSSVLNEESVWVHVDSVVSYRRVLRGHADVRSVRTNYTRPDDYSDGHPALEVTMDESNSGIALNPIIVNAPASANQSIAEMILQDEVLDNVWKDFSALDAIPLLSEGPYFASSLMSTTTVPTHQVMGGPPTLLGSTTVPTYQVTGDPSPELFSFGGGYTPPAMSVLEELSPQSETSAEFSPAQGFRVPDTPLGVPSRLDAEAKAMASPFSFAGSTSAAPFSFAGTGVDNVTPYNFITGLGPDAVESTPVQESTSDLKSSRVARVVREIEYLNETIATQKRNQTMNDVDVAGETERNRQYGRHEDRNAVSVLDQDPYGGDSIDYASAVRLLAGIMEPDLADMQSDDEQDSATIIVDNDFTPGVPGPVANRMPAPIPWNLEDEDDMNEPQDDEDDVIVPQVAPVPTMYYSQGVYSTKVVPAYPGRRRQLQRSIRGQAHDARKYNFGQTVNAMLPYVKNIGSTPFEPMLGKRSFATMTKSERGKRGVYLDPKRRRIARVGLNGGAHYELVVPMSYPVGSERYRVDRLSNPSGQLQLTESEIRERTIDARAAAMEEFISNVKESQEFSTYGKTRRTCQFLEIVNKVHDATIRPRASSMIQLTGELSTDKRINGQDVSASVRMVLSPVAGDAQFRDRDAYAVAFLDLREHVAQVTESFCDEKMTVFGRVREIPPENYDYAKRVRDFGQGRPAKELRAHPELAANGNIEIEEATFAPYYTNGSEGADVLSKFPGALPLDTSSFVDPMRELTATERSLIYLNRRRRQNSVQDSAGILVEICLVHSDAKSMRLRSSLASLMRRSADHAIATSVGWCGVENQKFGTSDFPLVLMTALQNDVPISMVPNQFDDIVRASYIHPRYSLDLYCTNVARASDHVVECLV